jgi:hypothetical protein
MGRDDFPSFASSFFSSLSHWFCLPSYVIYFSKHHIVFIYVEMSLLQKLTLVQLTKKFLVFYGTRS